MCFMPHSWLLTWENHIIYGRFIFGVTIAWLSVMEAVDASYEAGGNMFLTRNTRDLN